MKISSENLYIDFDRIRSMSDPEMDLLAYVEGRIQAAGSMIASHKHEIKTTKKILEKIQAQEMLVNIIIMED